MAAKVWGAIGYLDRTIKDPSILIKSSNNSNSKLKPILSNITFWNFEDLTVKKWRTRNTYAKDLLLYNICNSIRLGANIPRTAEVLWKTLTNLYDRSSDIAKLYIEE